MLLIILSSFVINKNIVQIYLNEFINKFEKYIVYILLLINEFIDQFERKNIIFINI